MYEARQNKEITDRIINRKGVQQFWIKDNRNNNFMNETVLQKTKTATVVQRNLGGTYHDTDKSDAHHMPSARCRLAVLYLASHKPGSRGKGGSPF